MEQGITSVVLLSGGLDSATLLFYVIAKGERPIALFADYGQRHIREEQAAASICAQVGVALVKLNVPIPKFSSALTDLSIDVPMPKDGTGDIPITYVPARNIVFLGIAASYAEALGAERIYIGANQLDYSGYPDCRAEFIEAFNEMLAKGTKRGTEGRPIKVCAPFLFMTKAEIIKEGLRLGVPYEKTWSCYRGGDTPCGRCDSCALRRKGFEEAGAADPLLQ